MAIVYKSEGSYFAANPKLVQFTGVAPGTRATFTATVTAQQEDPSTRQYTETFYRYADANGIILFDVAPIRQRGAATLYRTPLYATNAAAWVRNYETYFEFTLEGSMVDAANGEVEDTYSEGNMFFWGGTDVMRMVNDYNVYFLGLFSFASSALSKATLLEVNSYLPSFLLFKVENYVTGEPPVTYTIELTYAKGATSHVLAPTGENGQLNTQYLAATYGEGEWSLKRTDSPSKWTLYYAKEYTIKVNNDICVLEKIQNNEAVYLRWLNSLGGYSFGVFDIRGQSTAIQSSIIEKDYLGWNVDPIPLIAQGGMETLSKLASVSLSIGKSFVGWDQFEDLEDLLTSIEVLRFFPKRKTGVPSLINSGTTANDRWLPVQVSNGSAGDRSRVYNDFSCVLTMPQSFTQKR